MSVEGKLLSSVLNDKQVHVPMQANVVRLLKTHKDIWDYIKDHYENYQSVPSPDVVLEAFPDFDYYPKTEGTKYHLDELRASFLDEGVRAVLRSAAISVQDGKTKEAVDSLITNASNLKQAASRVKDLDAANIDSATTYYEQVAALRDNGGFGVYTGLPAFDACLPSGIMPGHLGIILAYPGIGKEMPLSTPIATLNGWTTMGDLKIGDYVIARNGTPTKVINTISQGVRKGYKVTFNDGTSTIAGEVHDWTVYSRDTWYGSKRTFVKETHELMNDLHYQRNNDSTRKPLPKWFIPLVDPINYPYKDVPVDPYTLGVFLGDGALTNGGAYIVNNDQEIIDKVTVNNPASQILRYNSIDPKRAYRYKVYDIYTALDSLGVCVYSHEKFIPQQYKLGSIEQRLELLRGLMDTDGHCTVRSGQAQFHTSSKILSDDVADMVRSLGGIARQYEHTRADRRTEYRVHIQRLDMNPFSLSRKADLYVNRPAKGRAIVSIEECGMYDMRCITVADGESLYLANDYIVTHNSWLMAYFAVQAWRKGKTPLIVSLEMTEAEVRNRIYTIIGSGYFSHRKLSGGFVDVADFKQWHQHQFDGMPPIHIISAEGIGAVTPSVVAGKTNQYKPDVVFLDYLNLMSSNERADNETMKMKQLSTQLKQLAVADEIPIIAISSATPDNVSDMNSAPSLGQVAWSKQISYDADWLIALGRDVNSDVIQVVFRKNRHGMLGEFYITVDFDAGSFTYRGIDP